MKNSQNEKMKQRIRRIKTQFNDSAKINQQHLFEQTKILHKNQINYAKYADKITDKLFPLKPLEIGFVQSLTLKDDPKFKEIRHLLQKYNQQVLLYDQKSAAGLHLKTVVMDSMLKFLRLLMQAPDAIGKKRILDISYYWFKKNLDSSKKQRKTKQSLQKQVRNILIQSKLIPKSIIDKQLPSQKLKEQLYNYQIEARTNYKQLDAPYVQLENYITHKLGFVGQNQKFQNQMEKNKKTAEELKQQKWKKRIVFKKPFIQSNYDQLEEENLDEQNDKNQKGQIMIQPGIQIKQGQKPNQVVDTNNPNTIIEGQQNINGLQQVQIGSPLDAPQQQQIEQEQKPKKGKLDPLVKIFLLDRQKRIKTQGQFSADNKYQFNRNKKLEEKRIDQTNVKFLSQWAGTRSRFKSQLSRKIQSIRAFSSITNAKKEAQPVSKTRVQHMINRVKLNQTLRQYGDYIHKQPIRQHLNTQTSMSLYDRKRIKTQSTSTFKPFSTVIEDRKRIDLSSQYLDEIIQIKQKFGKYKLYAPLDNFRKAIMHPQEKDCNWSQLDNMTSDRIQLPRGQMISNPFANFGKKKKKKGKKKK